MKSGLISLVIGLAGFAIASHLRAQVAFAPAVNYAVGHNPRCVVAADVNEDGKMDLISVNDFENYLSVLTNNGNGSFVSGTTIAEGSNPFSVTAADVNGDGKTDLICANFGAGTLSIFTNNGFGGFTLSSSPVVGYKPSTIIVADVNNDGKPDLITGNDNSSSFDNTLTVLTNNGSGDFLVAISPLVDGVPRSVTAADVNEDGYLDLISAGGGMVTVLTNNQSGGFVRASWPGSPGAPETITPADVNGDGHIDLITLDGIGNTFSVFTNNGHAVFKISSSPIVPSELAFGDSLTAADVNGDGKMDLIIGNDGGYIFQRSLIVLINDGSGGFTLASSLLVGGSIQSVITADVNGDGKLDLITANYTYGKLVVFINVPTLSINSLSNNLSVFWPSSWTNWTLQLNSDFLATNWSVSDGVLDDGTNKSLTIPSPTDRLFFRLAHP